MPYLFENVIVQLRIAMSLEAPVTSSDRSSVRVTVKPSIVIHDLPLMSNAFARRPTSVPWRPGLPPPAFTYNPCPATYLNVPDWSAFGELPAAVSRAPSANTCNGDQLTLEATQTLAEYCTHLAGCEKSSAPSITTPGPFARNTIGASDVPEAGNVIVSR